MHGPDLAWRVVARYFFFQQPISRICDPEYGLGVSRHNIEDVLKRYEVTGSVETRGADPMARRNLTRAEDYKILLQLVQDQRAQFVLEVGVLISFSAFCSAEHRLGFVRKRVDALCSNF